MRLMSGDQDFFGVKLESSVEGHWERVLIP